MSEQSRARLPGRAPIEAYGNGGFRFGGMSHRGSILCLPSGVEEWGAASIASLTPASFTRVIGEARSIEILLIGTGGQPAHLAADLAAALRRQGLALDPMTTGAACRTYNVLLAEGRAVAAALIAVD